TVYGVVTEAAGEITLDTEPGSGTTFHIDLPPAAAGLAAAEAAPVDPGRPAGNGETILVVEDDDSVRDIVLRILTSAGYQVLQAARPDEALELCRQPGIRIDVLLTDAVMPGMAGTQLIQHVQRL